MTIATSDGTGAAFASLMAGGASAGLTVVIEQQQFALIVETGGVSRFFFCFDGQQHASRIFPSMLQRKLVRANAVDGRSTAKVSRVKITRRTTAKP